MDEQLGLYKSMEQKCGLLKMEITLRIAEFLRRTSHRRQLRVCCKKRLPVQWRTVVSTVMNL